MAFQIIDLPVTLGTLEFIKLLKDLKEERLAIKQFTPDQYKIFENICENLKKYNPSMLNLLSSWYQEIGFSHCRKWCFFGSSACTLFFIINA